MKAAMIEVVTTPNNSMCPSMGMKTRMICFAVTFVFGIILFILAFANIPGVVAGGSTFAIYFTLANLVTICS